MSALGEKIQQADWKAEKHVPVIEVAGEVRAGEPFTVKVTVGKATPHPNTTEHHIRWLALYFHPRGGKFVYEVGRFELNAHGEAVAGANQGPVYSQPEVSASLKVNEPGTLHALALCNIHGLWESSQEIAF